MPAAEFVPEPSTHCKKCQVGIFYDEIDGTWRAATPEARVTCPTGGPHSAVALKLDWDSFEDVLTKWEADKL